MFSALSFDRPLSLSKGKVNSHYMHFVALTSLRPCSVRRDKLSQRIYSNTNYLYHKQQHYPNERAVRGKLMAAKNILGYVKICYLCASKAGIVQW